MITDKQLVQEIEKILDDKKGIDIKTIELEGKTIIADYFIIVSGTSTPHVKALSDEVEIKLKEKFNIDPLHVEGRETAKWILSDYGNIILHVFNSTERTFYSLEKLWDKKNYAR